jgi:hypothetical protein
VFLLKSEAVSFRILLQKEKKVLMKNKKGESDETKIRFELRCFQDAFGLFYFFGFRPVGNGPGGINLPDAAKRDRPVGGYPGKPVGKC